MYTLKVRFKNVMVSLGFLVSAIAVASGPVDAVAQTAPTLGSALYAGMLRNESGFCITVNALSRVVNAQCNAENLLWVSFESRKTDGVLLSPKHLPGKCMAAPELKDGVDLIVADCESSLSSQEDWVGLPLKGIGLSNTKFCLDVETGLPAVGSPIQIFGCVATPNFRITAQTWFYDARLFARTTQTSSSTSTSIQTPQMPHFDAPRSTNSCTEGYLRNVKSQLGFFDNLSAWRSGNGTTINVRFSPGREAQFRKHKVSYFEVIPAYDEPPRGSLYGSIDQVIAYGCERKLYSLNETPHDWRFNKISERLYPCTTSLRGIIQCKPIIATNIKDVRDEVRRVFVYGRDATGALVTHDFVPVPARLYDPWGFLCKWPRGYDVAKISYRFSQVAAAALPIIAPGLGLGAVTLWNGVALRAIDTVGIMGDVDRDTGMVGTSFDFRVTAATLDQVMGLIEDVVADKATTMLHASELKYMPNIKSARELKKLRRALRVSKSAILGVKSKATAEAAANFLDGLANFQSKTAEVKEACDRLMGKSD